MSRVRYVVMILLLTLGTLVSLAQDAEVVVPDVTGLNVPQAAASLNAAGLALGAENSVELVEGADQRAGTIVTQSVEAGTPVTAGTAVDVDVLRENNIILIYDDNDITLINTTNNVGDITGLRFVATDTRNPASFAATRWGSNVREEGCTQLWSVAARAAKPVSGCQDTQWLTTSATGEHFWTRANRVREFAVVENGITRATCQGAPRNSQDSPTRCEFYLDGAGSADDLTAFLYLAYTRDSIAVINRTDDLWMLTDRTTVFEVIPNSDVDGDSLTLGDPALFGNPTIVGDITRLAPNQCLILTADDATPVLPTACDIIAQQSLPATDAFWLGNFELESASDGQRHACPRADETQMTICIVPQ